MNISNRRAFIKKATALASYPLLSTASFLTPEAIFAAPNNSSLKPQAMDAALQNLLKGKPIVDSDKIRLKIASSGDNKNPVPITVQSDLQNIKSISLLVERNPAPLVATFEISPALEVFIATRIKLAHTSFVFALLESNKVFYGAKQKIIVSESGCEA